MEDKEWLDRKELPQQIQQVMLSERGLAFGIWIGWIGHNHNLFGCASSPFSWLTAHAVKFPQITHQACVLHSLCPDWIGTWSWAPSFRVLWTMVKEFGVQLSEINNMTQLDFKKASSELCWVEGANCQRYRETGQGLFQKLPDDTVDVFICHRVWLKVVMSEDKDRLGPDPEL